MSKTYNSITVLEGLKGVRSELAMYLGGTGVSENGSAPRALTQMFQEIFSNANDESHSGFGDVINVTIFEDQSMSIRDYGRGIPAGKKLQFAIDAFTKSHASGKFDATAYAAGSTGMHGIGAKAVNAGSEWMRVCVQREDRTAYELKFERGVLVSAENVEFDECWGHGTEISFLPDTGPVSDTDPKPVLSSNEWTRSLIEERCEIAAFLNTRLTVNVFDHRETLEDGTVYHRQISYPGGAPEYLSHGKLDKVLSASGVSIVDGHEFVIDISMMPGREMLKSFANGIRTSDGGYHEEGLRQNIGRAFTEYVKSKKLKLTAQDILAGSAIIMHVTVPAGIIEFESQTKEKLGTAQARAAVAQFVKSQLLDAAFDNPKIADEIVSRAVEAAQDREAMAKARELAKKSREATKVGDRLSVSSKLKTASSRDPREKELIITEGDSASGIGRDPKTQAIFPLRGKVKNVFECSLAEALSNKEISTIASVLGAGVFTDFDPEKIQYHKVIVACDADSDGGHISTLLLCAFYKLFPGLIDAGMLYVVQPPLYKAVKYVKGKPEILFVYSESEMDKRRSELQGYEIRRFKGLGEMSPDEAFTAIGNKRTRHIRQVSMADADEAFDTLRMLMGKDLARRKEWISTDVDFSDAN